MTEFFPFPTHHIFAKYNITCLSKLNQTHFFVSSNNKNLRLYNSSCQLVRTFTGHMDFVYRVAVLSNGTIVSGSWDLTIRFWKSDGSLIHAEYIGSIVWCILELQDGTIVFGCTDGIFVYKEMQLVTTLIGHEDSVQSLCQLKNGLVVSGSDDCTIKIWNVEKQECVKTLIKQIEPIYALCALQNGKFASASHKTITIWNENGKCLMILNDHSDVINSVIELSDGSIVSGADDGTIKIWDCNEGKCLQTLVGHVDRVTTLLELKENVLISGSCDGFIKFWKQKESFRLVRDHYFDIEFFISEKF